MEESLMLIANALEAVPDGLPIEEVPDFVRKHVLNHGGSGGAALLARAIVRSIRKGSGPR